MDPKNLLAQLDLGTIGRPGEGFGPWGGVAFLGRDVTFAARYFTYIISRIIGVMTIIAGIWFLFSLITGAYGYLSAGGDSQKVEKSTKKITHALIGLIIVILAYAITSLLSRLLGFDILNPQNIIRSLGPR